MAPAAGWSATSFLAAIACVSPGSAPATLAVDARVPIVAALDEDPHVSLLSVSQREVIEAWVAGGALAFRGTVHPPGIVDPRSSSWHGKVLRDAHWAPMLDANDPNACGRCHDGTASRPAGVTFAAPGAPACTSCHNQPGGVLACTTCHGFGERDYPPRDPCFFPQDAAIGGAHAVHVQSSAIRSLGLACTTCHPLPGPDVIGGTHGDGLIEVVFDPTLVEPGGSYDPSTHSCTVSCHNRGGARPNPAWDDTPVAGCNDCHGSPPSGHYPGACSHCHAEANADGTALNGGPLHLNGHVDLGNGSGQCGACHGQGDDPWPVTGAHAAHKHPTLTVPLDCANCHVVPASILDPVHLDGVVHVTFSGLATARNAAPTWDGATCSSVACHGANLADPAAHPAWTDSSGVEARCGACHGIPPREHTTSLSCNRGGCHGDEVAPTVQGIPTVSESGKMLHINGVIDYGR